MGAYSVTTGVKPAMKRINYFEVNWRRDYYEPREQRKRRKLALPSLRSLPAGIVQTVATNLKPHQLTDGQELPQ